MSEGVMGAEFAPVFMTPASFSISNTAYQYYSLSLTVIKLET